MGRACPAGPKPLRAKDLGKVRSVGIEPTISHTRLPKLPREVSQQANLAPYCVMAYSAPLKGFPHYHRHHASTPDIKRVIQGGIEPLSFAHGQQVATCVSLRQFQFATLKLLEVYTLPKPYQVVPH